MIGIKDNYTGARLSLGNMTGQSPNALYYATGIKSRKAKNILLDPRCKVPYKDGNSQAIIG